MTIQTGTDGNDLFFFNGITQQLSISFINPYSGDSFYIDEELNVNIGTYNGKAGRDSLVMSNSGDALFIADHITGEQRVFDIEYFIAGTGGDVVHLASNEYHLGNIYIDGGDGDDILLANIGDDIVYGQGGNDFIDGGPGNDILWGGSGTGFNSGDDIIHGGTGADMLFGEDGNDILRYSIDGQIASGYTITNAFTGAQIDIGGHNISFDIYDGGEGYDIVTLSPDAGSTLFLYDDTHAHHDDGTPLRLIGIEQIDGGNGNDIIDLTHDTITYGDITIYGGGGDDIIWSSSGDDIIHGGDGNDYIDGGAGNDIIDGGDGDDILYGNLGNDIIRGGNGNDIIYGGVDGSNPAHIDIQTFSHSFNTTVMFPSLAERVHISDLTPPGDTALGIAAGDLSVSYATTAEITFLSTGAGYDNSLGFYNIAQDGTILSVTLAFPNVKAVAAGTAATIDLPGAPDTDFGFFIVSDGARKNADYHDFDPENGEFRFIYKYGDNTERLASINDHEDDISLVYYSHDGLTEKIVNGSNDGIYHTTTRGGDTHLNGDNEVHVVSGLVDENDPSTLRIGFEDLKNLGDADFNDVVFDLTVNDKTIITPLIEDNNILDGGAGDDIIYGGIGNDIIIGGEGADILYGGYGSDIFVYFDLSEAGDTIMDFELGTEGDALNLTDLLEGFNAANDDINDFMQLVHEGGHDILQVNIDGQGDDFVTLLTFDGGLGGATISTLYDNGQIITDQAVIL